MTETVIVGRWYPGPAPSLEGETDDTYTDRLTGAARAGTRPYDHARFRQCSIGYHTECSCRPWYPGGSQSGCECPCHTDPGIGGRRHAALTNEQVVAARTLAALYDLPLSTGYRVIAEAVDAVETGGAVNLDELRAPLEASYTTILSDGFLIDIANVLGYKQRLGIQA